MTPVERVTLIPSKKLAAAIALGLYYRKPLLMIINLMNLRAMLPTSFEVLSDASLSRPKMR